MTSVEKVAVLMDAVGWVVGPFDWHMDLPAEDEEGGGA
jgi:hypothetical protein